MNCQNEWDIEEEISSEGVLSSQREITNSPKLIADRCLEVAEDKNMLITSKGGIKHKEKVEFIADLNKTINVKIDIQKKSRSEDIKVEFKDEFSFRGEGSI